MAAILSFFRKRISHNFQSYQPILLILKSKHGTGFYLHVLKCEDIRSKVATVIVPDSKVVIMATMRSSHLNFQYRRKMY